jgi:putative flippase GtrA
MDLPKPLRSIMAMRKYTLLSCIAAVVELSLLYVLGTVLGIQYLVAVVVAYVITNTMHFLLIKYYCFDNRSTDFARQVPTFIFVLLGALGLTMAIVYVLVEFAHIWYFLARIIALVLTLFYSYNMHKRFTFRP